MAKSRDVVLERLRKRQKAGLDEHQPSDAAEADAPSVAEVQEQSESAEDTPAEVAVAAPVADDQAAAPEGDVARAEPEAKRSRKRPAGKARGKSGAASGTQAKQSTKAAEKPPEEQPASQQPAPEPPAVGEGPDLGLGRPLPPFGELPDVVRLEDDLFVRDDGKLLPADAQVKMTFTMSVRERHRMREYARLNRVSYVDVFRAGVQLVLGDEEE